MGNANVQARKVGAFAELTSDDGALKRVTADGDKIPIRRLFIQLDDVCSVSCKADDNDVVLTLKNGVEYLLDELEEPTETYAELCRYIAEDEYDS
mmetsp:Transcript_25287/g.38248  ORF Transcript_25287/g.38248 Transcript_25287/m.38248 type:complete len:95 (-) Transcript_25287:3-287(-)|eukprot:CAMPEP_0185726280 /NCGR_PEP_ID=MMETSP1171-20130828/2303_1 /TAXON_ID=374046 /ORGANISM="Helicotheca tamensis, Strain CCMP826" /LENGTH=94 /DNA_ID=CAMNT_0028394601 /DNA_START=84 /DNA_END=368 /DNA_ORIENTATION=-